VAIHSIVVTENSQLFKKIICGHNRVYPRVDQVALIKEKGRNFTVYTVDSKKSLILKKLWHKHYKNVFLQRNVAVKSFQNIKRLFPKE